jgi:hypothetical protein
VYVLLCSLDDPKSEYYTTPADKAVLLSELLGTSVQSVTETKAHAVAASAKKGDAVAVAAKGKGKGKEDNFLSEYSRLAEKTAKGVVGTADASEDCSIEVCTRASVEIPASNFALCRGRVHTRM